MLFFRIFL